ncbi:altered inheritance of mitochondria protein 9, mitochondrial-like [Teratosphaeria destructans]|uniref:Altered inheritance of mitochondria protein 9, mitochondrial-like n=1 Tax=Teratosphaeria destructans TaxID=418781 RepID=A0A9W7SVM3_9PEZI|nr:altered inheritance of mitochondria protein 9, mitochondrial-like [Teratosphaeria destructans]
MRLPDYYETMEDEEEKAKVTEQVEKSILLWYYGREIRKKSPPLDKIFNLPLGRKRREIVDLASEVWDGEVVPLRECLYQLQRCWDQLETGVTCPISFTANRSSSTEPICTMRPVVIATGLLSLQISTTNAANCKVAKNISWCMGYGHPQQYLWSCQATSDDPDMHLGPAKNNCNFRRLGAEIGTDIPTKYYCHGV